MPDSTLYILVEGKTEAEVIRDFLQPYWEKRFASCTILNFFGNHNLKKKYVAETKRILSIPDSAVLVLIDIKNDPFGVQANSETPADAFAKLQKTLYAGLGMSESASLGVFPVVIEPETWLLADTVIQKEYLPKIYKHPETERDPAEIIERHIKFYKKGQGAKKLFAKASATQVYEDNCPHFVLMVNWIIGKHPTTEETRNAPKIEDFDAQKFFALQERYESLTKTIESNLNRGQNAAAGVLRVERAYIEQQMRELFLPPTIDKSPPT